MKNDESKHFSYSVHVLFSTMYFFDSKNSLRAMGVVHTAPQYPQVCGKIMREALKCSKYSNI